MEVGVLEIRVIIIILAVIDIIIVKSVKIKEEKGMAKGLGAVTKDVRIVDNEIDVNTGEIVRVREHNEYIRENSRENYLLFRTTDGIGWVRMFNKAMFQIFVCICYNANRDDNTVNLDTSTRDEIAMFLKTKRSYVNTVIKKMKDEFIVIPLWGSKYMINPDIFSGYGNKYRAKNIVLFNKAMRLNEQKSRNRTYEMIKMKYESGKYSEDEIVDEVSSNRYLDDAQNRMNGEDNSVNVTKDLTERLTKDGRLI